MGKKGAEGGGAMLAAGKKERHITLGYHSAPYASLVVDTSVSVPLSMQHPPVERGRNSWGAAHAYISDWFGWDAFVINRKRISDQMINRLMGGSKSLHMNSFLCFFLACAELCPKTLVDG